MSCPGVGWEKRNTAVSASGVSTASRLANTTRPRFCSGFHTCIAEKATSAELKGWPSCHLTPGRSLKVNDLPSAAASQEVARTGRSGPRSEEHTSELQSLMRISYAVFCLKKKTPH